jgi:hypothetical protein
MIHCGAGNSIFPRAITHNRIHYILLAGVEHTPKARETKFLLCKLRTPKHDFARDI